MTENNYTYKVKIERVRRAKLEAKYHWEVELYNNDQYVGLWKKTKHDTSGYAYNIKTAKKRALRVILDHDIHQDEYGVVFLENKTAEEMKELLS